MTDRQRIAIIIIAGLITLTAFLKSGMNFDAPGAAAFIILFLLMIPAIVIRFRWYQEVWKTLRAPRSFSEIAVFLICIVTILGLLLWFVWFHVDVLLAYLEPPVGWVLEFVFTLFSIIVGIFITRWFVKKYYE